MKIVYCIPALANSGGMERVLSYKANYLAELGHEIHIITSDQMDRPLFFPLDSRIQLHDLGINHEENNNTTLWRKLSQGIGKELRHRRRLRALLMRLKANVVISMFGLEANFLPSIPDGSRKILEFHFSKLKRLQYGRTGLWRLIDLWRTKLDERTVVRYDDFVVLTHEDRDLWGDLPNIHVIPNPLPFESETVSSLEHKRVIAAGRYNYQKNFAALIDIWAMVASELPDWHLDIYGDGEEREPLQRQIDRLGLGERITLRHPTKDMPKAYLESSIYVMTSHYEGLPMVLLEAQTMGLPIISYACQCGPRDIIEDGQTGYLIPMGDQKAFADALLRLAHDPETRSRMGRAAKEASLRYRVEPIMQAWQQLLGIGS